MWSCHACAETNGNGRATCFACGEPQPADRSSAVIGGSPSTMTRRERVAMQEAAYRSERHAAMEELGLRSFAGEDHPSHRYEGVVSGHTVSVAWAAGSDQSGPSTTISVDFPSRIGPAGFVVARRPVLRPFVRRLEHRDGNAIYVGGFTPEVRSRWLTPERADVLCSSLATLVTRHRLSLTEGGHLPTVVVISNVRGLVADAAGLA